MNNTLTLRPFALALGIVAPIISSVARADENAATAPTAQELTALVLANVRAQNASDELPQLSGALTSVVSQRLPRVKRIVAITYFTKWASLKGDATTLSYEEFKEGFGKAQINAANVDWNTGTALIGNQLENDSGSEESITITIPIFKPRPVFAALTGELLTPGINPAGTLKLPTFLTGAEGGNPQLSAIVDAWVNKNTELVNISSTGAAFAKIAIASLTPAPPKEKGFPTGQVFRVRKTSVLLAPEELLAGKSDKGDAGIIGFSKAPGARALYNIDAAFTRLKVKPEGKENDPFSTLLYGASITRTGTNGDPAITTDDRLVDTRSYYVGYVGFLGGNPRSFLRGSTLAAIATYKTDLGKDARILNGEGTWTPVAGFGKFQTSRWFELSKNFDFFVTPTLALGVSDVREQTGTAFQDSRYGAARLRAGLRLFKGNDEEENKRTLAKLTYFRSYSRTLSGDTSNPTFQNVQLDIPLDNKERVNLSGAYKSGAKTPTSSVERGYDFGFALKY